MRRRQGRRATSAKLARQASYRLWEGPKRRSIIPAGRLCATEIPGRIDELYADVVKVPKGPMRAQVVVGILLDSRPHPGWRRCRVRTTAPMNGGPGRREVVFSKCHSDPLVRGIRSELVGSVFLPAERGDPSATVDVYVEVTKDEHGVEHVALDVVAPGMPPLRKGVVARRRKPC